MQFLRNLLFHFESFWFDVGHFYSFNFLTVIMRFKFYLCDPLQQLFQDWPSLTSLCLWDLWSPFLSNSFWISLNFYVKSELLIVIVTLISPLNLQNSVFPIFSLIPWIYKIFLSLLWFNGCKHIKYWLLAQYKRLLFLLHYCLHQHYKSVLAIFDLLLWQ